MSLCLCSPGFEKYFPDSQKSSKSSESAAKGKSCDPECLTCSSLGTLSLEDPDSSTGVCTCRDLHPSESQVFSKLRVL